MIRIIFLLILLSIGAYRSIVGYRRQQELQKSLNRYNRSVDEEFEVITVKDK